MQIRGRTLWVGCLLVIGSLVSTPLQAQSEPSVADSVAPPSSEAREATVGGEGAIQKEAAAEAPAAAPAAAAAPSSAPPTEAAAAPEAANTNVATSVPGRPQPRQRLGRTEGLTMGDFLSRNREDPWIADFNGFSLGLGVAMFTPQHRGWERFLEHDTLPLAGITLGCDFPLGESLRFTVDLSAYGGEQERYTGFGDMVLSLTQATAGVRLGYLVPVGSAFELAPFAHLSGGVNQLRAEWMDIEAEALSPIGIASLGLEGRLAFQDGVLKFMGATLEFGAQAGARVELAPEDEDGEDLIPVRYATFGELGMFAPFARMTLFLGF